MFRFDSTFRAEFREKWLVLVVGFCCFVFGFAAPTFALPFVFPEVIREFGWSREEATLLASSKYLVGALAALLVGRFVDVVGVWLSLIVTISLGALALISFLWTQDLTTYYLAGILLGFASGGTMVAPKVLISRAFHASQGTAMGVAMLGTTIGSVIVPILVAAAIGQFGWRSGVALMSAGSWLVALPLLFYGLIFKRHALNYEDGASLVGARTQKEPTLAIVGRVAKELRFWLIGLAVFLVSMVDQAFTQHQVLIFTDIGLSRDYVAMAVSAIGLAGIVTRVLVGNILDATSNKGLAALYALLGLAVLLALALANPIAFIAYVIVRATAHAAVVMDDTVMTKHVYGPAMLGTLIGVYTAVASIGFAIGPWLMGRMFDASGSYVSAFILFGTLPLISAALILAVRPVFWLNMRARDATVRREAREAEKAVAAPAE